MTRDPKSRTRLDSPKIKELTLNSSVTHMTRAAFGKHLDGIIKQRGMSQSDLARDAFGTVKDGRGYKVSKGRHLISKYCKGLAFPDTKTLKKIAGALDMTLAELLPPSVSAAIQQKEPPIRITSLHNDPTRYWIVINRVFLKDDAEKLVSFVMDAALREGDGNNVERKRP